jgi:TPR repeat protein
MFEVLRNCVKRYSLSQDTSSSNSSSLPSTLKFPSKRAFSIDQDAYALPNNLPDFESFKYMTLADAAKQHKLYYKNGKPCGDVETAYKCFEAYANNPNTTKRNQITAKYYKAIYISNGLIESPPNKDKIVAEIFKEVADDETSETSKHSEAKLRYGNCLYYGKGVEKNESEAHKYFEEAAEDGIKVAMYNVGIMYYKGIGCTKDIEKAKYYMELAVYNGYEVAIKLRNEYNL